MSIEAWAFLVSRNPYIDYRTIVAPDFICAAGIPNLLARAADGELTEIGHAICRRIEGSDVEDFTIIFRVIEAKGAYINSTDGNNILKDSFGREIYLIEGLVVKGTDKVSITNEDLENAHEQVKASYQKFWEYTDIPMVESSSCFSLKNVESIKDSDLLNIEEIQPLKVNSKKKSVQISSWECEKKICLDFRVSSIAFSPNENQIVVRGYNPLAEIYSLIDYTKINSIDRRLRGLFNFDNLLNFDRDRAISFSPDGKLLAFSIIEGTDNNNILVWNVDLHQEKIIFKGHRFGPFGRIYSIAFNRDCNLLASSSQDSTTRLWDLATGEQYGTLQNEEPVYSISFSPKDSILVCGSSGGNVEIWDVKSKSRLDILKSNLSSINSVAFSSDGSMLAIGGDDNWVDGKYRNSDFVNAKFLQILDMKTKKVSYVLDGHSDQVNSVAFSLNGQVLASGSKDGNVKLWDVNSGKEILTLLPQINEKPPSEITSVAFSPDGQLLASSSMDGYVTIWRS
jgi:WD40 repeat protein